MIAIITPNFRNFYQFTKYPPFDGRYFEVKFADKLATIFGRNFDGYILIGAYYEVKDYGEIIEYLETHGAKRISI